jgi:hypothetical protein
MKTSAARIIIPTGIQTPIAIFAPVDSAVLEEADALPAESVACGSDVEERESCTIMTG